MITWVRVGSMVCLPSALLPHQLTVLLSGSTDKERQQASGIAGLAILKAETLAVSVGHFYFPSKLSGSLDTLWRKPKRPVWLTASGYGTNWQQSQSFWFCWWVGTWWRCIEGKAPAKVPLSKHLIRVLQPGWDAQHRMTQYQSHCLCSPLHIGLGKQIWIT